MGIGRRGYDVVVIGGGSAGCVAAARLSEDAARHVLLLEAGPDPRPVPTVLSDPAQRTHLRAGSPYVATYPTRRADGSTFLSLAGRVMGGGSSVNFMDFLRPLRHDLEVWARFGDREWSYQRMLPLMKAMESDHDFPDDPIHGSDGPVHVTRPFTFDMPVPDLARALIARAQELGLPLCDDMNAPDPLGICAPPCNLRDGRRVSTTVAYLDPARERNNLQVVAGARVTSLAVAGGRVEAVRYEKEGATHVVAADRVVLSAGVFGSPQVLMLSGIGPARQLESLGITVVHALEGVAENYQDHAVVAVEFLAAAGAAVDVVLPRVRLLARSDPGRPCADLHIIPRVPVSRQDGTRVVPVTVHLLEQRNRGRIRLVTTDPNEPVAVDAAMLEHPGDVSAMTSAMHFVDDLVRHDSLSEYYGPMVRPSPSEDWATYARATHDSYHHGVGTCRMGRDDDPLAVVDGRLRVRGLDDLWIADASTLPTVTHSNTNVAAMLTGEVAARSIAAADRSNA